MSSAKRKSLGYFKRDRNIVFIFYLLTLGHGLSQCLVLMLIPTLQSWLDVHFTLWSHQRLK